MIHAYNVKIGFIYFLCGIFGNIVSSIFLPLMVLVGASGSIIGFLGVLISDLILNWKVFPTPKKSLAALSITIVVTLLLGLMPWGTTFLN